MYFRCIYTYSFIQANNSIKNHVCYLLILYIWQNKLIMLHAKQINKFSKSGNAKTRKNNFTTMLLNNSIINIININLIFEFSIIKNKIHE